MYWTLSCNWLFRLQNCMRTWKNGCPSSTCMCQRELKLWITPARTGWTSSSRLESLLHMLGWREPPMTESAPFAVFSVPGGHRWRLLSQLLCSGSHFWRPGLQRVERLRPQNHSDGIILEYFYLLPWSVKIITAQVLLWCSDVLCSRGSE